LQKRIDFLQKAGARMVLLENKNATFDEQEHYFRGKKECKVPFILSSFIQR
jgi:hypothetical protein